MNQQTENHNKPQQRRLIVVMENGVYQSTLANFDCADIELVYVEYDNNGLDADMVAIPQSDGNTALAYASTGYAVEPESSRTLCINAVFNAIEQAGG